MRLKDLIKIADDAYPDGLIGDWFDAKKGRIKKGGPGDTLARFIVVELCETYDAKASDQAQLEEAERVMSKAVEEIRTVEDAFSERVVMYQPVGARKKRARR